MNRNVWLFRILGIVMLFVFTLMMWDLYSKLVTLQERVQKARPAVTATSSPAR